MKSETIYLKDTPLYIRVYKQLAGDGWWFRWSVEMWSSMSIDTSRYTELRDGGASNEEILRNIVVKHPPKPLILKECKEFDFGSRNSCVKDAMNKSITFHPNL